MHAGTDATPCHQQHSNCICPLEVMPLQGSVLGLVPCTPNMEGLSCWLSLQPGLQEAIHAFGRLPPMQYSTGWVLSCIGRAYFEMVDYKSAAEAFEWARKADPSRLEVLFLHPRWPCPSRQAQSLTWRSFASVLLKVPAAKLPPYLSPHYSNAEHSSCPEL